MRVLSESWCFCNGRGKSERLKASIFSSKSSSMANISSTNPSGSSNEAQSTGFLIHKNLLLTTHANIPSVNAAELSEIRFHNGALATLLPHRFFITSSVLDLTVVGLDTIEGDSLAHCSKPNLELGNNVYLLGHAEKKELTIGEGKVVIATDNLIKLSTEGFTWSPGSAGFDSEGNLAFMICDPMKLATSSSTSSSSSASRKKNLPMQFGIPMPIIFDWLNQHWEGSLDDLSKSKLPLTRLMSTGHKSEHSCASFTMRQVFKATQEIETTTTSSSSNNIVSRPRDGPRQGFSGGVQTIEDEKVISLPHASLRMPGIPTLKIYESPKVTSNPVKTETTQIRLLSMGFPPRICKASSPHANSSQEGSLKEEKPKNCRNGDDSSSGSVGDGHSEVQSSCSPAGMSRARDEMSSEGETFYSAETAESRNYTSPSEGRFKTVGRSQSCVSYNRWGPVHRNPVARRSSLEKQTSYNMQPRKTYSQGTPSHKTMDYFSPTVSSVMKKRNNLEQQPMKPQPSLPVKARSTAVGPYTPKWNF